jgi:DNA replication and repair protein RecF
MRSAVSTITLTDFRSYDRAELTPAGRSAYLFGPNGAGKTNLLEAVSLLSPGRGMRASSLAEFGRRRPDETSGRAWAISAVIAGARPAVPRRRGRTSAIPRPAGVRRRAGARGPRVDL